MSVTQERSTRWIIVDDIEPSIVYGPGWFSSAETFEGRGNLGSTFEGTLHGTNTSTTLSFAFEGPEIKLLGTNDPITGTGSPSWTCYIDGVRIGAVAPAPFFANNWELCRWSGGLPGSLADKKHNLSVEINPGENTFWVDYITYSPSAGASIDNPSIFVSNTDPAFTFDDNWQPNGDLGTFTSTSGAVATFEFTGTKLSWFGGVNSRWPKVPTMALFSIDNGTAQRQELPGSTHNSSTLAFQRVFQTSELQPGPHSLSVEFLGSEETTALSLAYVVVENGNFTVPRRGERLVFDGTTATPVPTTTPTSTESSEGGFLSVGALVGIIIAGLLIIIGLTVCLLWYQRRRKARNLVAAEYSSLQTTPFYSSPRASFSAPPPNSAGSSTSKEPDPPVGRNAYQTNTTAALTSSIPSAPLVGGTANPFASSSNEKARMALEDVGSHRDTIQVPPPAYSTF